MTDKKVGFITGAGRGMGVNIAKAALAAGNKVVATGRNTNTVAKAIGESDNLLLVKLDATSPADAKAAQKAQRLLTQADAYRELSSLAHETTNA